MPGEKLFFLEERLQRARLLLHKSTQVFYREKKLGIPVHNMRESSYQLAAQLQSAGYRKQRERTSQTKQLQQLA